MSLVLRLPRGMHLCRSSSSVPRLPTFLKLLQNPHTLLTFSRVENPLRLPRETTSDRPNVLRTRQFFYTFDFEMCFAPQRRALFRHVNFQKWSEHGVLCTFWLRNVLRATTACALLTSQLPNVVRTWCVFSILTSACASRRNGVHFADVEVFCTFLLRNVLHATTVCNCLSLISLDSRWLRTRRFSEPTFGPSGATNHRINTVFRDFSTFSGTLMFFLLLFSSLLLLFPSLLFICPYCPKFDF